MFEVVRSHLIEKNNVLKKNVLGGIQGGHDILTNKLGERIWKCRLGALRIETDAKSEIWKSKSDPFSRFKKSFQNGPLFLTCQLHFSVPKVINSTQEFPKCAGFEVDG